MTSKARELANLGNAFSDGALSNRNLIINGAMQVAQRGTSVTGVTETDGYKTVDRFQFWTYSGGTYTLSQDSAAPSEFAYSHKVLNTATTSTVAGTGVSFRQRIEAQNLKQLGYNTVSAKDVTLSFWVKSSATGTWAVRIYNPDSGRMVTKTYAISSANTWEKKEITFTGDTSGAINSDNGYAFEIAWWLAAGTDFTSGSATGDWETYSSTKEADGQTAQLNTGGDWAITGVQLEVGDTATPFEHRSYGQELALCQRYCWKIESGHFITSRIESSSSTWASGGLTYPVTMRSSPTYTESGTWDVDWTGSNLTGLTGGELQATSTTGGRIRVINAAINTYDGTAAIINLTSGSYALFDAEL